MTGPEPRTERSPRQRKGKAQKQRRKGGAPVARRVMRQRELRLTAALGRGSWPEGEPSPSTDDMVGLLEEYRSELEQETAKVTARIAELKGTP